MKMQEPLNLSHELEDLAYRVLSLVPDHRNPERYHVTKSEIFSKLRTLASAVEGAEHG